MRKSVSPVTLLGSAVGVLGVLASNWLLLKENRIVQGEAYSAFGLPLALTLLLLAVWVALALCSIVTFPGRPWALGLLASAGLLVGIILIGQGTQALLSEVENASRARVSLRGGVWVTLLAYYIGIFGALGELRGPKWKAALMVAPGLLGALLLIALGTLNDLGLAREFAVRGEDFAAEVVRHLALAGTSVFLAAAIGVPAAIQAARSEQVAAFVLPTASLLQTLPSLALFGLMLGPLAQLGNGVSVGAALLFVFLGFAVSAALIWGFQRVRQRLVKGLGGVYLGVIVLVVLVPLALLTVVLAVFLNDLIVAVFSLNFSGLSLPATFAAPLSALGVRGIGTAPALIALTLYALLPIVRNCYTGIKEVPKSAIDAGRGMGMSQQQILRRVELPLALPLIVEGLRASAVLTIGIATVAFLIGAGGLGTFIESGISQQVPDLILLGAIPIILLALLVDALLRGVGALLTSPGIRS